MAVKLKKKGVPIRVLPSPKTHAKGCLCHKCKAHPAGCKCRHCMFQSRRKLWSYRRRRRRMYPSMGPRIAINPGDENKVTEDIFDKVYKYFEVGTYEAVTRECRKLVQTCDLCKGTGIDKGSTDPENPLEPRLCPRCSDARYALKVLDGLRESAADVKPKAVYKEQP